MDCAHLSDAELLRLVREGGETSSPAQHELERRHFSAVQAFAAVSAVNRPAAGELAHQSWEAALRQQGGGAGGAVRPCALSSVLRTASEWARGNQRVALYPQLAAWIDATGPVVPGSSATAGVRPSSLAARAFAGLSYRSQTILWHHTVERENSALTGRLIGAGPGEVSALTGRALGEFYSSYVQVLRDGMQDECRRYHRLVLAYADTRSDHIAGEVAPHLERCVSCSRAVTDLGRVRHDCGALLVQALLPWGGPEYAARGTNEGVNRELMPGTGMPIAAAGGLPAGGRTSEGLVPASMETASQGIGGQATGKGRHAAFAAAATGARTKGRRRGDLVVRGTAVAGVCAVGAVLAFGFVGDSTTGDPQSKEPAQSEQPAKTSPSPSKTPSPSRTTAIAKSTSKPNPKPTKSKPAPPEPSTTRPSSPSVGNAAVQWKFNQADGNSVTSDSSGNNKDGSLFGASRPRPVNGALPLDGRQFVASDGPVVDTSRSFTVSARVKLNRTDLSQTAVSQDSSESSAFMLQYDADESQWEMRIPKQDTDDAEADADEAGSKSGAEAGEWTHLTGVYDDADDEVRLYVDGRLAETVDREDDFASSERFIVGRGLSGNEFFQGLDGTIDDVQAFGKAVSSAEAKSLARKS